MDPGGRHLGRCEARQGLVEEHDAGAEGQRHGQLQELAPRQGQDQGDRVERRRPRDRGRGSRAAAVPPPGAASRGPGSLVRRANKIAAPTFSAAVRSRKGRGVWKVRPTPRRADAVARAAA